MLKRGGLLTLLLVLSLPALSGPHFVPPGLSPVQPGKKAAGSPADSTESSTTTGVEAEANSTSSPTQPLKIEIDMEEVPGNATQPVWHPYLIRVTGGAGTASTPPPLLAEEATVVEMSPSTNETTTTTTTTVTTTTAAAAPELIIEELTAASPPADTGESLVVIEVPETTTTTTIRPPPDQGQQQQFVPNKTELGEAKDQRVPKKKTKQKKPPQPEDQGEPEKPKPTPKDPSPLAGEALATAPAQAEAQRPQVYLLIKESQPDSQKQTDLPLTLQIISTQDLDLGSESPVSSTKDTGTIVSNTANQLDNIISINDQGTSVEETIDRPLAAEPHFREVYFDQVVDHFSFTSHQKTYLQRYLITDEFWGKSFGPIFLYTGNEGDVWDFANNSRFLIELASEQKAMVIFAEHRYYGKSLPFGKKSYDKSNIEFLTVEQALADYAVLLTKLKTDLDAENCPVITFGGSYGGMLSAYMRIKYPNIVAGALASSAPVASTANIGDSRQFFHDVTKDFERDSPDCVSKIREAFDELESLAQQQAWSKITSKLSLCKPIKSRKEVDHLYGWARNAFTYLAMFDYPYKTEVALHFPANPVNVACRYIQTKSDHIDGLLDILGMFYNSTGTQKCFDIYTEYIHCADPTGCGLGAASLAWDFQACTEINLLYESTNETDMFPAIPFTEAMRMNYCHSKWGVHPNSEWLKIQYWGDDFKAASNIIFSNGNLDPWANGGILKDVNPSVVAFIIEGGAHHLDLRASNPADPPSVTAIRKKESSIIGEWVKKHQAHFV